MNQQIEEWCLAECERQHATSPADILRMQNAWDAAAQIDYLIDIGVIRYLGMVIDPIANPGGRFRTGPAVFMNGGTASNAADIEAALSSLLMLGNSDDPLTPEEFYRELMWVHPFKDGNGRVGALVYNMLNGTIDNPVTPPEYR